MIGGSHETQIRNKKTQSRFNYQKKNSSQSKDDNHISANQYKLRHSYDSQIKRPKTQQQTYHKKAPNFNEFKLSTQNRAIKRKLFENKQKDQNAKKMEEALKLAKEREKEEIKQLKELRKQMYVKANPVPKNDKQFEVTLPHRKIDVPKIPIYDRGLKLEKQKQKKLAEMRKIKYRCMGLQVRDNDIFYDTETSPRTVKKRKKVSVPLFSPNIASIRRMRTWQSMGLRQ